MPLCPGAIVVATGGATIWAAVVAIASVAAVVSVACTYVRVRMYGGEWCVVSECYKVRKRIVWYTSNTVSACGTTQCGLNNTLVGQCPFGACGPSRERRCKLRHASVQSRGW